jgi:hypothetical protein
LTTMQNLGHKRTQGINCRGLHALNTASTSAPVPLPASPIYSPARRWLAAAAFPPHLPIAVSPAGDIVGQHLAGARARGRGPFGAGGAARSGGGEAELGIDDVEGAVAERGGGVRGGGGDVRGGGGAGGAPGVGAVPVEPGR